MIEYQVGGSLSSHEPSYVVRQADELLAKAIARRDFCYILDSRQMGKSSLMVRAQARLQAMEQVCVTLDLTNLGSHGVTAERWYKGIGLELCLGLNLLSTAEFIDWWQAQGDIPYLQKLSQLISSVLLPHYPQTPVHIFVDEVDSILSLDFAADDWFALIRYCYNQRALDVRFQQIVFVLAGVATPSDLIADKTRTPFNVGYSIELQGFRAEEAMPLAAGLAVAENNTDALLRAILSWTGGQPFLTQKLCQLVAASGPVPVGHETDWVERLVSDRITTHWESQDEPEHLRTIRDRILRNETRAGRLLGLYQKLLNQALVPTDDSIDQTELVLSGLVYRHQGQLKIKNPIYRTVFDLAWVDQQLSRLRPYAEALMAWQHSKQTDESRLLQGQALQDAQQWARGKSLDDLDYAFLSASEARNRQLAQQQLELAQAKEVKKRLHQEQRASRLQRYLLGSVSATLLVAAGLGLTAFGQYRRAAQSANEARQSEIAALVAAAEGNLASDQTLDALIRSIQSAQRLRLLDDEADTSSALAAQTADILQQAVFNVQEVNRFSGSNSALWSLDWSPDGQTIATVGGTTEVHLWRRDGTLLWEIDESDVSPNVKVKFSPDGQWIAVGGQDGYIRLYDTSGNEGAVWTGHEIELFAVNWSPDGNRLASASSDGTIRLWNPQGQTTAVLEGHTGGVANVVFSPDNQFLVSTSSDETVRIWPVDDEASTALTAHRAYTHGLDISPNSQHIISGDADGIIKLWRREEKSLTFIEQLSLEAHEGFVRDLTFSPDGQSFASTSGDGTVKLWDLQGRLLHVFSGHQSDVHDVVFSEDGTQLFSVSQDKTLRVWQIQHPLKTVLRSNSLVFGLAISPDGQQIASGHADTTIRLWQPDGRLIDSLSGHDSRVVNLAFSPNGEYLASSSSDRTINLWSPTGELQQTLRDHSSTPMSLKFNSTSDTLVSASIGGNVGIWEPKAGELLQMLPQNNGLLGVDISPDDQYLTLAPQTNQVWIKTFDDELVTTLSAAATESVFSPNGQLVATANWNGDLQLWQVDGRLLHTLSGHQAEVYDVAFSPDSQLLASTSADKTVRLWNLEGQLLQTLHGHTDASRTVRFSPDGDFMVSSSADGKVIVWQLADIFELDQLSFACQWVEDYLRTSMEVEEQDRALCNE